MMTVKKMILIVLVLALIAGGGIYFRHKIFVPKPAPKPLGGYVEMAVHRALYGFKLVAADPGAGLNGVSGRMYFEQDDTCDAWTTDRRFTMEYQYAERQPERNSSHYVAFESKDGRQFSFNSERQSRGEKMEVLRGMIEARANGSGKAVYSRPANVNYALPKSYMLPMAHTEAVIRHARAGDRLFDAVLFDGTDADGPVEISTFIGHKATAEEIKKIRHKQIDASLLSPDAWHVRMALFPLKDREDMTSVYEMDMILHDNGVISDVMIDYGVFRIAQNLLALEKLPAKKCH